MSVPNGARVRVPCSTSNLGAGFDHVGIALDRWLEASVVCGDDAPSLTIARGGTLASLAGTSFEGDHLFTGFRRACAAAGVDVPRALAFQTTSEIPVARGLGSSAASLVAGALLARAALGLALTDSDIIAVAAGVEGHPDNVSPMVLGGAILAVPAPDDTALGDSRYACARLDVHPSLGIALSIPDFETSTPAARAALPEQVPHRDAVAAAGKGAALVYGLASGDPLFLADALDDVLHVPYRRHLMPGYDTIVAAAREAGAFGATLSGSGSTILALGPRERASDVADAMAAAWRARDVAAEGVVASIAGAAALG